jgi:hypothetical protein
MNLGYDIICKTLRTKMYSTDFADSTKRKKKKEREKKLGWAVAQSSFSFSLII